MSRSAFDAIQILIDVYRTSIALGSPQRFAQAFEERVFRVVHLMPLTQGVIGGANSRRLVDADLIGKRQVQREMKKRVHLPAFGSELLVHGGVWFFQQGVVFRMLFDEVGCDAFGAFENQVLAVFSPGFAKETADLLT